MPKIASDRRADVLESIRAAIGAVPRGLQCVLSSDLAIERTKAHIESGFAHAFLQRSGLGAGPLEAFEPLAPGLTPFLDARSANIALHSALWACVAGGRLDLSAANTLAALHAHRERSGAAVSVGLSQAFYRSLDDQIVLVADRIEDGDEVAVYLHEVVHRHGRGHLGAKALGRLAGQVLQWSDRGEQEVERQIHDRALARAKVSGEEGYRYLEEVFAYAVEEAVKAGVQPRLKELEGDAEHWLGEVVATLRAAVLEHAGVAPHLDAQQVVDLAYALAQMDNPVIHKRLREVLGPESMYRPRDILATLCSLMPSVADTGPRLRPTDEWLPAASAGRVSLAQILEHETFFDRYALLGSLPVAFGHTEAPDSASHRLAVAAQPDDPPEAVLQSLVEAAYAYAVGDSQGISSRISGPIIPAAPLQLWHGSPYKFEKFDVRRVRSGEGGLAYGWGIYLAESREVAMAYTGKDSLSSPTPQFFMFRGQLTEAGTPEQKAADLVSSLGLREARKFSAGMLAEAERGEEWTLRRGLRYYAEVDHLLTDLRSAREVARAPVFLYSARVQDTSRFLQWDTPTSEQPDIVLEALRREGFGRGSTKAGEWLLNLWSGVGAGRFEDIAAFSSSSPQEAVSLWLRSLGVEGIRYRDSGSRDRNASMQTSNYVVFDDCSVRIEQRIELQPCARPTAR